MLPRGLRAVTAAAATAVLGLALVAPVEAVADRVLHAGTAIARSCFDALLPDGAEGADRYEVTSEVNGLALARLNGAAGDWDLAVFDRATGALLVASTALNSRELAEGFVTDGQELVVQACRYSGPAPTVPLDLDFIATTPTGPVAPATGPAEKTELVRVATPEHEDKSRLLTLDLDVTERADATSVDVVLTGGADRKALRDNGFRFEVLNPDVAATARANGRRDVEFAATTERTELPSGRTSYRNLWDYSFEMKELARLHPDLVRAFTLPHLTVEGREVVGVEVATAVGNLADGKPVNLTMGLHHAREWPAGEHAVEWVHDLVQGYAGADTEIRGLVERTRSVVVPVVNPDGFAVSREAAATDFPLAHSYDWKRKNCRADDATPEHRSGRCRANSAGRARGTDLNRNYAGFWGGAGASVRWDSDTFRGSAPFSEPETRNVRDLVSNRQVTNMLTLHTDGNLLLRVPGTADTRPPLDEPVNKALGDLMASRNGYTSQYSWQLYDTAGTAEDWSYWATGGYAYTMEIGVPAVTFHPPFETGVVAEYVGKAPAAGAGRGGNRRAFLDMLANTATPEAHSTVVGTAPAGHGLALRKAFQTPTSRIEQEPPLLPLPPLYVKDVLESRLATTGGRFEWAVNPSTRPYVAGRYGREPVAPVQPRSTLVNPEGIPAPNGNYPTDQTAERVPFTVGGPPRYDNAKLTVTIGWGDIGTRWNLHVLDAAGQTVATSNPVVSARTGTAVAVLLDPPPGEYTAVVVNFRQRLAGTTYDWTGGVEFSGPVVPIYGTREAYVLTCKDPSGTIVGVTDVHVDRGETADVGDVCVDTGRR